MIYANKGFPALGFPAKIIHSIFEALALRVCEYTLSIANNYNCIIIHSY